MACRAVSAASWRKKVPHFDDGKLLKELHRSWGRFTPYSIATAKRDQYANARNRHDWADFRTYVLREVRRRGLEVPDATLDLMAANGVYLWGGV